MQQPSAQARFGADDFDGFFPGIARVAQRLTDAQHDVRKAGKIDGPFGHFRREAAEELEWIDAPFDDRAGGARPAEGACPTRRVGALATMRHHDAKPPLVSHALHIGKSMKSLRIAIV